MAGPDIAVRGYRIRLPSGKTLVVPAEFDLGNPQTKSYIDSIIARDFPEDATKLGIKNKPVQGGLAQTVQQLGTGVHNLVGSAEGLIDFITGDDPTSDDWGGRKAAKESRLGYTPEALGEDALGKINPGTVWRTVTESAPSTAVGVGGGLAAALLSGGTAIPAEIAAIIGLGTAASVEAGLGAGEAYGSTGERLKGLTDDPEEIKRQSQLAAGLAIPANLIPALAGGPVASKLVAPALKKVLGKPMQDAAESGLGRYLTQQASRPGVKPVTTTLGKAAAMAPVEGVEEALQSGAETAGQNYAVSKVDPSVGIFDNVPDAAIRGGLAGVAGGAMFGGGIGAAQAIKAGADEKRIAGLEERADINETKQRELATARATDAARAAELAQKARVATVKRAETDKAAFLERRAAEEKAKAPKPLAIDYDPTLPKGVFLTPPSAQSFGPVVRGINVARQEAKKVAATKPKWGKGQNPQERFSKNFDALQTEEADARTTYNQVAQEIEQAKEGYDKIERNARDYSISDSTAGVRNRTLKFLNKKLVESGARLKKATDNISKAVTGWNESKFVAENPALKIANVEAMGASKAPVAGDLEDIETRRAAQAQGRREAASMFAEEPEAPVAEEVRPLGDDPRAVTPEQREKFAAQKFAELQAIMRGETPQQPQAAEPAPRQVEPILRTPTPSPLPSREDMEAKDPLGVEMAEASGLKQYHIAPIQRTRPGQLAGGYRVMEVKHGPRSIRGAGKISGIAGPVAELGTFQTEAQAQDALIEHAIKNRIPLGSLDVPQERIDAVAARGARIKDKQARAKADLLIEQNVQAWLAVKEFHAKKYGLVRKVVNEELKKAGLDGRNLVGGTIDDIKKILADYNEKAGLPKDTGLDKINLSDTLLGKFITHGTRNNPIGIIAVNKDLIHSGMKYDEMVKAIKDVLHHEMTHSLVRGGFITPDEYSMLLRLVRKRLMPGERGKEGKKVTYLDYTRALYSNLSPAQQEEEAIAELFRLEGMGASRGAIGSEARGVIDRVIRLIKAIFSAFHNKDFQNFVDMVEDFQSGNLAKRIKGNIGFDPNAPVDPLGRSLGSTHADMRLSIPMGNQETADAIVDRINEFVAENGRLPKKLSLSPIYGGVYLAEPVAGPAATMSDVEAAALISKATDYESKYIYDLRGGKVRIYNFIVENPTTVGQLFDLSALRKANPSAIARVESIPIINTDSISDKFKMQAAGFARSGPGVMSLVNGKEQPAILVSPEGTHKLFSSKTSIMAALTHEVDHALKESASILAPVGSSANFDIKEPAPENKPAQAGSRIEESLSYGATLLANKVNLEMMDTLAAMKRGEIPNSQPMQEIFETSKQAAEDIPERLWQPIFNAINLGSKRIHKFGYPDHVMAEERDFLYEIGREQANEINDSLRKVFVTLTEKYPDQANFIAYAINTNALTKTFETLRHMQSANEENLGKLPPKDQQVTDPTQVMAYAMSELFFKKAAQILDLYQYTASEGEQMAFWAQDEKRGGSPSKLQVGSELSRPGVIARPNKSPDQYTEGDVRRSFPSTGLDQFQVEKLYENVGIPIPDPNAYKKIGTTESDMSMDNMRGLNMGDVSTLFEIMRDNETAGVKEITRMLNERKTSSRRPYREGEVQGLINRLSSIDPALARDGVNIDAMLKYERLWGTGRLKDVIADAQAGMGDHALARKHGLARASLRAALDEMNVARVATTQSDMSTGDDDNVIPFPGKKRAPSLTPKEPDYVDPEMEYPMGLRDFHKKFSSDIRDRANQIDAERKRVFGVNSADNQTIGKKALADYKKAKPFHWKRLTDRYSVEDKSDVNLAENLGQTLTNALYRDKFYQRMDSKAANYRKWSKEDDDAFGDKHVLAMFADFYEWARDKYSGVGTTQSDMKTSDDKKAAAYAYFNADPANHKKSLSEIAKVVGIDTIPLDRIRTEWRKAHGRNRGQGNRPALNEIDEMLRNEQRNKASALGRERLAEKRASTTESDMAVSGQRRYPKSEVTAEMWKKARLPSNQGGLTEREFDVFDLINTWPTQYGPTLSQLIEKLDEFRDPNKATSEDNAKQLIYNIRQKGYPVAGAMHFRTDRIMEIHRMAQEQQRIATRFGNGKRPRGSNRKIAKALYAEEIANSQDIGMSTEEAISKYANVVSSVLSQAKDPSEKQPQYQAAGRKGVEARRAARNPDNLTVGTSQSDMRIKLTGFDGGSDFTTEDLRHELDKLGYENPINPREVVVDGGAIEAYMTGNNIWLKSLRSVERGGGRKALEAIIRVADANGVGIELTAEPFDTVAGKDMSGKQLTDWYKQFGFVDDGNGDMHRDPKKIGTTESNMSAKSKHFREFIRNNRQGVKANLERFALNQEDDAILDQMTSLHRVFGRTMGDPENFIFDHINTAEGLERLLHRYREAGGSYDFSSNPVFQDEKSKGRTTPEVENTTKEVVDPILDHIKSLNVTDEMIEELASEVQVASDWFTSQKDNGVDDNNYRAAGLYLLAKHAPEREAFIRSKRRQGAELRNAEGNLGVGIQLPDAARIVDFFHKRVGEGKMSELSTLVKNATNRITSIRKDGGLIPRELTNAFNFYVPARGFSERDGENDLRHVTLNIGSRGRTPLRQDPVMKGRLSLPDDPIVSIAQMLQVAIMRKNINSTLNSMRRLIEANTGLFEAQGKFVAGVHYEKPPNVNLQDNPLWLRGRVMRNPEGGAEPTQGKESDLFYIELAPEFVNISRYFMPSMFEQQQVEKLLASTKIVEPAINFIRDMRTAKNPAFLPVNLVRDIGTGVFNIEMYIPNSQLKFLARAPTAAKQILQDTMSGKYDTKYGKLAKEYIEAGGSQKLHVIDDYDRLSKKIADKIKGINSGDASAVDKTKGVVKAIFDVIDKANNAAELVSRVTAYSIAKEHYESQGMSPAEAKTRAMYIGRNLTVNFNKHGNLGKGINNLYMFWNASVGGTSQIFRAMESNPKLRMQVLTIALLGFAMPFILKGLMGDEYDKIPDWVKDRNLIIPLVGTGNYLKIPLPYGYSWPYSQGMMMGDAVDKVQNPLYGWGGTAKWLTLRSIDNFMNNFAPTGSSKDFMTLMAPTLADPILELASNKDWTGRPIMPEPGMKDYDRESQRYWSNTSPLFTGASNALSAATGGQGRMDGLIEISPNALEYTSEFIFGGLGKLINQSVALAAGKADGVNDIPFVRSFTGSTTDEVSVSADYAQLQNRVKRVEKSIDDAKAARNFDRVAQLEREFAFEVDLIEAFKRAERKISNAQSARRGIENKYRESTAQPNENDRQRLDELRSDIKDAKVEAINAVVARQ